MASTTRKLATAVATAAFVFAACGGGGTPAPGTQGPGGDYADYKACVAFSTGGLGDKGFNDLAKLGLEEAKAAGFQTAYSEAKGASDYAANLQRLMDDGCLSITTIGFDQVEATVQAAKANPDIAFSQVDITWDTATYGAAPPNYTGIDFQVDQAGMLAGYLAAGFTKSGKVGTYGGQQFPGVTRFMDGLYAGVMYYNEQKGTNVEVLGWNAAAQTGTFVGGSNPWGDAAKGEQLAKTFVDQGADIVHPVAGSTGNGSFKYMLSRGMWSIGVDTDQSASAPEYAGTIITSVEKVINTAVLDTFKMNAGGKLGGDNYIGTLENGGVRLAAFHDFDSQISAELKAELDDLKAKIISGEVKVADYMK